MNLLRRLLDARAASLAVIALVVLAAAALCLDTALWWRAEAASLRELEHRTGLLEARADGFRNRPGANDAGDRVDGRVLVFGETPGLVIAELQRIVTVSAEGAGAMVRALDTPEGEPVAEARGPDGSTLQRVRLAAEIEVLEQSLPDLLYAIETELPVMIVDSFTLRSERRIADAGAESWTPAADRTLSLRLAVSAFRHGDQP